MAIETKCQTSGAIFNIHVTGDRVNVEVQNLPLQDLTEKEAVLLEANLHNAMELVLARYYVKK